MHPQASQQQTHLQPMVSSLSILIIYAFHIILTCYAHDKTIIAYYASWQIYDRDGKAKPVNLDYSKFTRVNFAFFQTTSSGDIYGTDEWGDALALFGDWDWSGSGTNHCSWDKPGEPPVCKLHIYNTGLIYLAHEAGVEIYPSIGGWTLSETFSPMAANPTSRKNFARNCAKLVEHYEFDGIDIDWEYPTYAAHGGGPADTANYSLLMKEIRAELDALGESKGRSYGLTAAMPCGPDLINGIELSVVKDVLSEFNLMTYDFHGSWSPETSPNAPLYDYDGSPQLSVHGCTENFLKGGVIKEKINIGLPFYGRSFLATSGTTLTDFGQSFSGSGDLTTWADDEGQPQYFNIKKKISELTSVRSEQTKTQFAYNDLGLVSYDDELAICEKTEYALDNDLHGYIIWEISGDIMDDLSTPLLDTVNGRLNNPNTRCGGGGGGGGAGGQEPTRKPTNQSVVEQQTANAPTRPTGSTANGDGEEIDSVEDTDPNFYPYFESNGKECRNDDIRPGCIKESMLSAESLCCETYFPYGWNEQCRTSSHTKNPFYPDFRDNSCVNDGEHPDWMAGDYLNENEWLCCQSFFSHNQNLLDGCLGALNCADC